MTDIVETLRVAATHPFNQHGPCEFLTEAADEITRLRAEIERLRAALRWFVSEYDRVQPMRQARVHAPECRCILCAYDNARAALGGSDE